MVAVAQAFKETLAVSAVATALEAGIRAAGAAPTVLSASDGGDGLTEVLAGSFVRRTSHRVPGPLGSEVALDVGWLDATTAIVESRLVCGLALLSPTQRNPSLTSTRGLGELVSQLEMLGARDVYVGLGGSATMDGGMGMARAWGWVPLDALGQELPEGGGHLEGLASVRPGRQPRVRLTGLVDVRNPLAGTRGARVYAAQKGASAEQADHLDRGLARLAGVAARAGSADLAGRPGAGAAGGLGFGILCFGGGSLVAGAPWVLQRVGFAEALQRADLVLCGEGAFDATSLEGKLTGTVLAAARDAGVTAGLLAPRADAVPAGVLVETGGDEWSAAEIARRAERIVSRALRIGGDV